MGTRPCAAYDFWMRTNATVLAFVVLALCAACSSSKRTEADCQKIADDIRTAAVQSNIPTQGICTNTTPAVVERFGKACADLKACNDEVND